MTSNDKGITNYIGRVSLSRFVWASWRCRCILNVKHANESGLRTRREGDGGKTGVQRAGNAPPSGSSLKPMKSFASSCLNFCLPLSQQSQSLRVGSTGVEKVERPGKLAVLLWLMQFFPLLTEGFVNSHP